MNNTQIYIIEWGNRLLESDLEYISVCQWISAAAFEFNSGNIEFHNKANEIRTKFIAILGSL